MSRCFRCGEPADLNYEPIIAHGSTPACERCITEMQLIHAKERVSVIQELEAKLIKLGGPAPQVYCGYIQWLLEDDPLNVGEWPFGQFCLLPEGHNGHHRVEV